MTTESQATVLVIEDDDDVRRLVARVLAHGGYSVVATRTGEEALRLCALAPAGVRVVVADTALPDVAGPELVSRIRECQPAARILLIAAHSPPEPEALGALEGVRFLQEPLQPELLLLALAALDGGTD